MTAPASRSWVAGRSLAEIVAPSFVEVEAAARSGLFDAVGHIDNVKRFLHPYVSKEDLAAAPELYEPILRALVDSGTALEINTSGLRHPVGETYPSPAIVARFRELGGRAVSIGSDAHGSDQFAWGLADGYLEAAAAGFESLAFRRGGERVAVAIPICRPSIRLRQPRRPAAGADARPGSATLWTCRWRRTTRRSAWTSWERDLPSPIGRERPARPTWSARTRRPSSSISARARSRGSPA